MRSLKNLRDEDLLRQLAQLVMQSRGVEADVVAHIGEVELRGLYAHEACSSMFEYCRRVLRLRENEAYLRITVARLAREYPTVLDMLRDGRLHLSGIARLAPHLTRQSAEAVLKRASGMSHREIRELVCELEPKPDFASMIRRLPVRSAANPVASGVLGAPRVASETLNLEIVGEDPDLDPEAANRVLTDSAGERSLPRARPAIVEPLAPSRYLVRFTADVELRGKLERLRALMRRSLPDGDPARLIDIAVTEKLERVEAKRFGKTKRPRKSLADTDTRPSSRDVPAAVKRTVYARDGGRCTYRNRLGRRCGRRLDVELHHKHPFGRDGDHDPANVTLMCKTHNTLQAEQGYGHEVMARFRVAASRSRPPLDPYGAPIAVQPRALSPG